MASIIAICPYCRLGGVRAPDTSIGAGATCPKCKSNFTVLPSDDIPPGWDQPAPRPAPGLPAPSRFDETRPVAATGDVTALSPVLPPEGPTNARAKPTAARPAAGPQAAPAATRADPAARSASAEPGLAVAVGAVCLVGPALLSTLLPHGRAIGLSVAAVGCAVGVWSLGAGGRARLAGGLAAGLHGAAVAALLFAPAWLDLNPWSKPAAREVAGVPRAVDPGSGAPRPIGLDEPIDAGRSSWQFGDARVTVRRVGVGPAEARGAKGGRPTKDNSLFVVVQVRNVGAERDIDLPAWAGGAPDGVAVTDANDQPVAAVAGENEGGAARPTRLAPGRTAEATLAFAVPPRSAWVQIRLSAAAFGVAEDIRFRANVATTLSRPPGK
jgi:hypothetical protein